MMRRFLIRVSSSSELASLRFRFDFSFLRFGWRFDLARATLKGVKNSLFYSAYLSHACVPIVFMIVS